MVWNRTRYVVMLCLMVGIALIEARSDEISSQDGLVYGKAGDTELLLDLVLPKGDGPFPALIFIHGGGWAHGDRKDFRAFANEAARRGYVAATISYRLMKFDEAKKETTTAAPIFPAQVHDVKAAVRWMRASAEKYHVDPNRIGVIGGSAGGHLSLMLGVTEPNDKLEGDSGHAEVSSRVQCVVNICGPTEMKTAYEKSVVAWILRLFLNGTPEESPELYKAASPATYVTKDDPPILTIHGDQDTLVNIQQAHLLDEKMKEVGASHTLLVLKGQGHGFDATNTLVMLNATWEFFDKQLKPATEK